VTGLELTERSRREQKLPPVVVDQTVIAAIAATLARTHNDRPVISVRTSGRP
jgi:hypothetical protein